MGTALSGQGSGLGKPVAWGAGAEIRVWGTRGWQLERGRTNSPTASDLDARCQDSSSLERGDLSLSCGLANWVWRS